MRGQRLLLGSENPVKRDGFKKRMRRFTFALVLAASGIAGQPRDASGQAAEGGLLERYTGMMNQLRTELTAKIPKLEDEKQVHGFLASAALDAKLTKYVVLHDGTPAGLAAFAQQGTEQERLIEPLRLWTGDTLMDLEKLQVLKMTVKGDYLFIEEGGFSDKNPVGWKSPLMVLKRKAN